MTADVHAPQEILEAENAALRRRLAAAERQATHQSSTSSTDAHGHDAEFLRDVLASSNDCIKVLDLDGNLTFMSGGGQRVMEVGDFNAIRGCPWPDFWRGPGHADAKAAVESARAGGVGRFQGPAETMAGTPRFWDVQVTPIRGAGGHVERLLSISRDITATWLAETTLRDSEANLRLQREFLDAVIRQAPVGIAITEAGEGVPPIINDKAGELLGHGALGVGARRFAGYGAAHPDGSPYAVSDYPTVRALHRGDVVEREEMLYSVGGGARGRSVQRRLEVSSSPIRDRSGSVVAAVTVFQDVEEARRAEAALRASEAHWRGLFSCLQEGFLLADVVRDDLGRVTDWRYAHVNPAWTELVGLSREATEGRTVREVIPGIEDAWVDEMARVVDTGEPASFLREVSGSGRWYEGRAFRVDGDRFAIIFHEVTARLKSELSQRALVELGDRLRDAVEPTEMPSVVAEVVGCAMGASRAGYGTMAEDDTTCVVESDWNVDGSAGLPGRHKLDELISFGDELRRGHSVLVDDVRTDPRTADRPEVLEELGLRSLLNLPIIEHGRLGAILYVHHSGPHHWTEDEVAFARDAGDRARSEIERRRAEVALRDLAASLERQVEDRARERSLTWQVTPDLLGVLNGDGFFTSSNPAWQTVLGWSRSEVARTNIFDLVHPEDLARTRTSFDALKRGEPVLRFENRYRTRSGEHRWLSWVAVPDGGMFYCSARDVTDEKTQEAQLSARTAERDRAWRLSQDLLVVAEQNGFLNAVNAAWTALLGWEEADLVGKTFLDLTHPDDLEATMAAFATIFNAPLTVPYEYRLRHRDGTYRWFAWTGAFEDGQVFAVGRHVTAERDQAEALLQTEGALRQAQKMEAVGQLTGGIAHDFNNLLTGITGGLDLLKRRLVQGRTGDAERYIDMAQGAAQRAAALTHRLLAFSRRQTLAPKSTDVNRLATGMEDLIRRTVGPQVAVETAVEANLWNTLVDPSQLENALLNLCINARDAMPDGGRIVVETGNCQLDARSASLRDIPAGSYVTLSVSDNGSGMPPEVAARAFDPFYTTKPIGQGTGLGLSMIYGFTRQSGGQVRIHSEVGQGTTVRLYLPRHVGELDRVDADAARTLPRAQAGETVLVVDDEPSVRMLVTDVLEDLGYAALEAGDGASGLNVLRSDARVDLLVTDVGLPGGMNGRQVADAARALRPGLKVLFITGYAETAVLSHGHLDPGMHVLTKPFAIDALASRIRELIVGGPTEPRSVLNDAF